MGDSNVPEASSGDNWTITTIAENWCEEGGAGPCEGCPAHWSHHPGDGFDVDDPPPDGAAPSYADGQSKNFEKIKIVVMGFEPGKHKKGNSTSPSICENIEETIHDNRTIEAKGENAGSLGNADPIFRQLDGDIAYWTQAKKCNEIGGNKHINSAAVAQCVGLGPYDGYLKKELQAVDPDYVVTLGKDTHKTCLRLINEMVNDDQSWTDYRNDDESWSELVAKGENIGKFQVFRPFKNTNSEFDFKLIPLPHPAYGIHKKTIDQFEEGELIEKSTKTKSYFKNVGQGLTGLVEKSRTKT